MINISGEVFLDTCLLEPPEPFVEAMAKLQAIQMGQFLHMIHRREPGLLYPELATLGLKSETLQESNQMFHIVIWQPSDPIATEGAVLLIQQLNTEVS